jgi:hypothetical protein
VIPDCGAVGVELVASSTAAVLFVIARIAVAVSGVFRLRAPVVFMASSRAGAWPVMAEIIDAAPHYHNRRVACGRLVHVVIFPIRAVPHGHFLRAFSG